MARTLDPVVVCPYRIGKADMALVENTLFGIEDKVALAVERIRHFERQALAMHEDGYFVAFSGGKDSVVLLELVRMSGVKHTAHFHMTTVDPPELLDFIRKNYPQGVEWVRPKLSMFQLIVKKHYLPTRMARFCCDILKEQGGEGRMVLTGVRWSESAKRATRPMVQSCYKGDKRILLHPVIDWSDEDVWEFIRSKKLPYCSLYDEGFKRIGCVGCPMSHNKAAEFKRWPRFEGMFKRAIAKMIPLSKKNERTVDEVWSWWMEENKPADNETGSLFE